MFHNKCVLNKINVVVRRLRVRVLLFFWPKVLHYLQHSSREFMLQT